MTWFVPAVLVAAAVLVYLAWFYLFTHDSGPRRNAEGRIVETSATEPLARFFRERFGRR